MSSSNETGVCMPAEACLFEFQIGGHKHGEGRDKWGVLKHKNGNILKPLRKGDSRSEKELEFYKNAFSNCHSDPILKELVKVLPKFYGTWKTSFNSEEVEYLCLEDVCAEFKKACVLEVKIGSQTHAPDATEEKILLETTKSAGGVLMGFRVIGMKVYDNETQKYNFVDRYTCRKLMPDTILPALAGYFQSHNIAVNCWILSAFIHKLLNLQQWFTNQRLFAFYGSSLLFVYEGDLSSWIEWASQNNLNVEPDRFSCENSSVNAPKNLFSREIDCECGFSKNICMKLAECSLLRFKMIDFAHTFRTSEIDMNYIKGLKSLTVKFQELLTLYIKKL